MGNINVNSDLLDAAKDKLKTLEVEEQRKKEEMEKKDKIEAHLVDATKGDSIDALKEAIAQAEEAAINGKTMEKSIKKRQRNSEYVKGLIQQDHPPKPVFEKAEADDKKSLTEEEKRERAAERKEQQEAKRKKQEEDKRKAAEE